MNIFFLGDVVGNSGCKCLKDNLPKIIEKHKIDFVIVNGENADPSGVGLSKKICEDFFNCGVKKLLRAWFGDDIHNFSRRAHCF